MLVRFRPALMILALLATLVSACGGTGTVEPEKDGPLASELEGVTWLLNGYLNREGSFATPMRDGEGTILFKGGQVTGTTGCNSYFSDYELEGTALSIGVVGVTEMYCFPEELMAQEADVLSALDKVATWKIEGEDLELRDDTGALVLTFSKQVPEPLVGTQWQLTSFHDDRGGARSVLAGTEITATLDEAGNLAGSAGCNSYFATVEVSGNQFTIPGPVGSTLMACAEPEGIMDQESSYLAALQDVATYEIEGRSLTLFDAEGDPLLTFAAIEPTPLVGTSWTVIGYNNGRGGVTSVLAGTELTATFGADGQVTGSAGCNSYFAGYELDGQAISIGQAGITEMFCMEPDGVMDQEAEFMAALQRAATYTIEWDRLQLRDADGALQVDLVPSEPGDTE